MDQQQREENNSDDYLQLLDAGEHMYGMFVADDEDLYAYLSDEFQSSSSSSSSPEDIEDTISRSVVNVNINNNVVGINNIDIDLQQHNNNVKGNIDCNSTSMDTSVSTGRTTPTHDADDHDVMIE